ncbi:MAG: NADP-dependent isocitrate dehydrogenase [Oligoflexia bacterium]|nr:NADP-dependent isocitrate dehydrogenase [Oligoflexia bacterium]
MSNKYKVKTTLVEIDGDEMTRIIWQMIKEKLIPPFIDVKLEYYDLHVKHRDDTNDKVTVDAANAIKKYKVGVKCATITPDNARVKEYNLKEAWKSPNGTLRAMLDGTVFRAPILVSNVKPNVRTWKHPIIIARHAYGDVYKNAELSVKGPGKAEIVFTDSNGKEERKLIQEFKASDSGILQGMHNLDSSIRSFASSCMTYALDQKIDLWFSTKDTISKIYDARFRNIFQEVYEQNFKADFEKNKIEYFFTLIDDAVARVMKSEGGFLWACKNYDGDVMSDMLASSYGSLAMMTSVLVSPNGDFEYEAAHGTVQKHYYKHLKGEKTSTNSMASIFAWSGALKKRGELDHTPDIVTFAEKLERSALSTIESGYMTGDMAVIAEPAAKKVLSTEEFIDAISARLRDNL